MMEAQQTNCLRTFSLSQHAQQTVSSESMGGVFIFYFWLLVPGLHSSYNAAQHCTYSSSSLPDVILLKCAAFLSLIERFLRQIKKWMYNNLFMKRLATFPLIGTVKFGGRKNNY